MYNIYILYIILFKMVEQIRHDNETHSEKKEKESAVNSSKKEVNDLKESIPPISKREWNVSYYTVEKWDTTTTITNKLNKYPEFNYLDPKKYGERGKTWRNETGFNIKKSDLKPGMELMIPVSLESRQFEDKEFFELCQNAIDNIQSNPIYWKRITDLVNKIWKQNLARVMSAFAKVETAAAMSNVKIWTWWLYRYESTSRYSVSYFHVLMEWAWLKALNNLGITPWEACDPINAWMLFLWYWCEVESAYKKPFANMENCLDPRDPNRFKKAARIYNWGSSSYPGMLLKSYKELKI